MARSLVLILISLLVVACRGVSAPPSAAATPPRPSPRDPVEAPAPDGDDPWRLTLTPLARSGRLRVAVETPRAVRWQLPTSGRLHEAIVEPHRVSYELAPPPEPDCAFEVTPDRAVFCGTAVLPTPDPADAQVAEAVVPIAIRLESDETFYPAAASSYGVGRGGTVRARFVDLRHAGFVFGVVHHATFTAEVGRDHAAWVGFFSFDPRWVAAEAAGVRTAVDRWLGIQRPPDDPSVGLLLTGVSDPHLPVTLRPLRRGALVQAGPSAAWDARARVDLTRLWAQRTIGHGLTVDEPSARWWFDEGFAHGVALVVLRDLGVLTPEEVATEASALLAQQAFAGEESPARASAVRGALLAIALEGADGHLQRTLRRILAASGRGGAGAMPAATFFERLGDTRDLSVASAARIQALLDSFRSARPLTLRAADVDRCAVVGRGRVHRFELGFTTSEANDRLVTVESGSAAARAGLVAGDALLAVDYQPGRSDVPVRVVVERAGMREVVRFHPRGPSRAAPRVTIAPGCDPR